MSMQLYFRGRFARRLIVLASGLTLALGTGIAGAQDAGEEEQVEEIVVTGTQIRGARINEALPVSVISLDDIEAYGIDSGDELLDLIPENGNNFFNEAENISGGVNAARGDVGAFNLRSLGTGNTLVLLNGRRLVLAPQYQTEEVGGSFVPVNSVNSNTIPVYGVQRVEVLRDGASAIYGADAVAGVVNTVLKNDLEGFSFRTKYTEYDTIPAGDVQLTLEWGDTFNNGRTNIGVFANHYNRDNINAQMDPKWADSDFRPFIPSDSPFAGSTSFRNNSINSLYGQYDITGASASGVGLSGVLTDSSGEFETYPAGDPRCEWDLGYGTCGAIDGQGTVRYNLNEFRDLRSALERNSLFVYINHELDNGAELFSEISAYQYDSRLFRHPSASFSTVKLRVAADNYWNPFGPVGSPNRLPDSIIGTGVPAEGLTLEIDNYRFAELPRIVDNSGDSYRFLFGIRGSQGDWDLESAFLWSQASADDVTRNRVSNTLMQEALNDTTANAYNPFSGGVDNNIERALVDVFRLSESELVLLDFKTSNPEVFDLPAGPVGILFGAEHRYESFDDDRDPRLDGTIVFTDFQGDTYPFVSDVVNSSPTPDSSGDRRVTSFFTEAQIPIFSNLDVQAALRWESHSDSGTTTVPKLAAGWRVIDPVLVRASWSEGFRAPNLVTINEEIVARQNTRTDWACTYAADFGGDPNQDTLDCRNSTQRIAQGSQNLEPEKSENWSVGLVLEPLENLMVTLDYWSIEKEDTIGLFGEENHTLLDLLFRLEAGTSNCAAVSGNSAVTRADPDDPAVDAIWLAAGLCPAGDIRFIDDQYANFDTRTVRGYDVGIYYDFDTSIGNFGIRYVGSFLDEFEQTPGGDALLLLAAQDNGQIPSNYPVAGFSDLIRKDGNQEERMNLTVRWDNGPWAASTTMYYIGDFFQDSLTLSDGTQFVIPSMTTYNFRIDYTTEIGDDYELRSRFGINNVADERAPLADRFFGFFADSHRDYGRSFYFDLRLRFD